MKMRTQVIALVLFVCTLASCSKEKPVENTDIPMAENAQEIELELLGIVNDYRISIGQVALDFNKVAYEYANRHNDYMISKGTLNHDNFSSRASKLSTLANAEYVAENVAKDYTTAADAFKGWLNSANHKKTMEGNFSHTAVSVKSNSDGEFYFTQIFFR